MGACYTRHGTCGGGVGLRTMKAKRRKEEDWGGKDHSSSKKQDSECEDAITVSSDGVLALSNQKVTRTKTRILLNINLSPFFFDTFPSLSFLIGDSPGLI